MISPMNNVLVVGAGPTGLVLAYWLAKLGVAVRIVDKADAPGSSSRAIAVAARTLELYRQVGLDEAVVERGLPMAGFNMWVAGQRQAHVEFGSAATGLSPFPYVLSFAQDEHERLLGERLAALGVRVERSTELLGFEPMGDRVVARLRRPDGTLESSEAAYLAGCDGARSVVRSALGIDFPGGTYEHLFYVADVDATGPQINDEGHVNLASDGNFVVCLALRGAGRARLIGTVRDDVNLKTADKLGWKDVNQKVIDQTGVKVSRVNWFSTYHVHHRVASRFRVGRIFLLGDAGHIHSPVGGQGMNTGIGDAVNLAWKLADVLAGRSPERLLTSYEEERVPFAQRLVRTTDRAFELVTTKNPIGGGIRLRVVPRLLTAALGSSQARRFMFRLVSQIGITYRSSSVSEGRAGRIHGGDRLPWVPGAGSDDNFAPLRSLAWQLHVYGTAGAALRDACASRRVGLHTMPWDDRANRAGLERDAAYLVRPDGYVAMAVDGRAAPSRLAAYFDSHGLSPG
jgi:2-polyprenyl-6-methoxyphenol hydroxylase-like FAD-dependent oxidoreductase